MSGKVKLYGFTGSNSVHTGRLMLEHKGLEYDFVKLPPAVHAPTMLMLGFPTMGVPAIKVGGVRVQGTRWIARALDEMYPDKPLLFPTDPAAAPQGRAGRALGRGAAERRAADLLLRRAPRPQGVPQRPGRRDAGRSRRLALRMMAPVVIKLATGVHRASDEAGREDVVMLPERMDQIDAWIADGRPRRRAAQRGRLPDRRQRRRRCCCPTISRPFIEGRPAAALARRVLPDYVGHIGPVVPAEWMDELRAAAGAARRRAPPLRRTRLVRHDAPPVTATARLTRAERSAQTRGELLDAAQRRFFEAGYHATTLDDIADDAGYTKGAVYSTFGSKAGLFLALFDDIVDQRLAATRAIIDDRLGPGGEPAGARRSARGGAQRAVSAALDRVLGPCRARARAAGRVLRALPAPAHEPRRARPARQPARAAALGARDARALQRVRARAADRPRRRAGRPHGRRAGARCSQPRR